MLFLFLLLCCTSEIDKQKQAYLDCLVQAGATKSYPDDPSFVCNHIRSLYDDSFRMKMEQRVDDLYRFQ